MHEEQALERELLSAMKAFDGPGGRKSVVFLRAALEALGQYDQETCETALCNDGNEEPHVRRAYDKLRELTRQGLAEGRGNFRLPAGPRYTECKITAAGLHRLEELLQR